MNLFQGFHLLKEILIVSQVELKENRRNEDEEVEFGVKIEEADGYKCERCWKFSESVGDDNEHRTLCASCCEALEEVDEDEEFDEVINFEIED